MFHVLTDFCFCYCCRTIGRLSHWLTAASPLITIWSIRPFACLKKDSRPSYPSMSCSPSSRWVSHLDTTGIIVLSTYDLSPSSKYVFIGLLVILWILGELLSCFSSPSFKYIIHLCKSLIITTSLYRKRFWTQMLFFLGHLVEREELQWWNKVQSQWKETLAVNQTSNMLILGGFAVVSFWATNKHLKCTIPS